MKIVLIGSGNVAGVLGDALVKADHRIIQVYSRSSHKTKILAKRFKAEAVVNISNLTSTADIYLLAVSDSAISITANLIPLTNGIVVHCSGSTPLKVIRKARHTGVFYPVETIRNGVKINFKQVPVCIEASDKIGEKKLVKLAKSITPHVFLLNTNKRAVLHMAAVFANNFTNHMIGVANDLLRKHRLPPGILDRLITTTFEHALDPGPGKSQTGPAVRNDRATMKNHLRMLKGKSDLVSIYKSVSESISKVHGQKKR